MRNRYESETKVKISEMRFEDLTTRTVPMATQPTGWHNQLEHQVTFDFTGCTVEHVMNLAIDAMKVKVQNPIRTTPQNFPAGPLQYRVAEIGGKQRATVVITREMLAARLAEMTEEEREAL